MSRSKGRRPHWDAEDWMRVDGQGLRYLHDRSICEYCRRMEVAVCGYTPPVREVEQTKDCRLGAETRLPMSLTRSVLSRVFPLHRQGCRAYIQTCGEASLYQLQRKPHLQTSLLSMASRSITGCGRSTRCLSLFLRRNVRSYSSGIDDSPAIKVSSYPAPHAGSIKIISLNRPDTRNALSRLMVTQLAEQLDEIDEQGEKGPTRALIVASESDKAFCAGADLKERKSFTEEE